MPSRRSLAAANRCAELTTTTEACERSSGTRPRASGCRGVRLGWLRMSSICRTVERLDSATPADVADRGCCVPPKSMEPRSVPAFGLRGTAGPRSLERGRCGVFGRIASWCCSSRRSISCRTAAFGSTTAAGPLSSSSLDSERVAALAPRCCPITPAPGTACSACSLVGGRCVGDCGTLACSIPYSPSSSSFHCASICRSRGDARCCARAASAVLGRLLAGVVVPSTRCRVRPSATSETVLCIAATSVRCVGMNVTPGAGRQLRIASPHERAAATDRFGPEAWAGGEGTCRALGTPCWLRSTDTAAGIAIIARTAPLRREARVETRREVSGWLRPRRGSSAPGSEGSSVVRGASLRGTTTGTPHSV
jgi:hypothetical protein